MNDYKKIYNDTDAILGDSVYRVGELIGRRKKPTNEMFEELKSYSQEILKSNPSNGIIMTIGIVLKPYKEVEIIKPLWEEFRKLARSKRVE